MTTDFNFFLPISKVEKQKDGSCLVHGYASTEALDCDGEIVSRDAVKAALPGYMAWRNVREMHRPSAVGVAKEANMDSKGLFVTSRITDPGAVAKCLDEVYKGYSIGGKKLAKVGNTITEIDLIEISLVDRPANPECSITVAKRKSEAPGDAAGYLVKTPTAKATKQLGQALASQVSEFLEKASGPPAAHDGFSLPAGGAPKTASAAAMCKAHNAAACPDCMCKKHSVVDCEKCAMKTARKLAKREFTSGQRASAASTGAALPDGSFPIENESDLHNAIRAIGRAKDPATARRHIRRRAKALGHSDLIPSSWSKAARNAALVEAGTTLLRDVDALYPDLGKSGGRLAAAATASAEPSFLTLKAGSSRREAAEGEAVPLVVTQPQEGGLLHKRMSGAGSLAYCFDSLRDVQRALLSEAAREGGDMKDKELAAKVGEAAKTLAAVISQKAAHEGEEATDLSDADDRGFMEMYGKELAMSATALGGDALGQVILNAVKRANTPTRAQHMAAARDNMKKARKARGMARGLIADVHKMHKGAYIAKQARAELVKAGKKPKDDDGDDDEFDHQGAMEKLQKAHSALEGAKTFDKAARMHLAKAASGPSRSGQRGQEAGDGDSPWYDVPKGVNDLDPRHMATLSPGQNASGSFPPELMLDQPFPGKAAKGAAIPLDRYVTKEVAELMAKNAALEAENNLLAKAPSGGQRPYAFNVGQLRDATGAPSPMGNDADLYKGVNTAALGTKDENGHPSDAHRAAAGEIVGRMVLGGKYGKSVFDPAFHGTGGLGRAN